MPIYRTSRDLAHIMQQSDETARRVLREVFGERDEPLDWIIGEREWARVLRHLTKNQTRRYGCRRRRRKPQMVQLSLL